MSKRDYVITIHARERYVQRTQKKYAHLQDCREEKCLICKQLIKDSQKHIRSEGERVIDENIYQRLDEAKEDRSYMNNSEFMEWYYNKYGFDKRFEFLVHDDLLFVVVWDYGKKVVVTCIVAKTHIAGKSLLRRIKFNHVKKQELISV